MKPAAIVLAMCASVVAGVSLVPHRHRLAPPTRAGMLVWRARVLAVACAGGLLAATRCLWTDPDRSSAAFTLLTGLVAYGHISGALLFSRKKVVARVPVGISPVGAALFGAVSVATAFALFSVAVQQQAAFMALTGLTMWHIVENEAALQDAYRKQLRLSPLPRSADRHAMIVGFTLVVTWALAAALAPGEVFGGSPSRSVAPAVGWWALRIGLGACALWLMRSLRERRRFAIGALFVVFAVAGPTDLSSVVPFAGLYAFVSMYHYAVWFFFLLDQGASMGAPAGGRGRVGLRVVGVHVTWLVLVPVLFVVPQLQLVRGRIAAPGIFLFWSLIHVAHTAWLRGISSARTIEREESVARDVLRDS
jgi:hypothetical protein